MYLGSKGGVCCPANKLATEAWAALSTKPKTSQPDDQQEVPLTQIYASAHEMAHFYIQVCVCALGGRGLLKVPEFVNSKWSWSKPEDMPLQVQREPQPRHAVLTIQLSHSRIIPKGTSKLTSARPTIHLLPDSRSGSDMDSATDQAKEESRTALRESNPKPGQPGGPDLALQQLLRSV